MSLCQILVRLYFISYATVTAKFRITKLITRSLAPRHIRQGLSFALYDGSHSINTAAVVPGSHAKVGVPVAGSIMDPSRHVGQSKHVAVSNPLIGWAREGFPEVGVLFLLRIDNHSLVYSFNVRVTFKTNEAVCKETTESPSTLQFSTCRGL